MRQLFDLQMHDVKRPCVAQSQLPVHSQLHSASSDEVVNRRGKLKDISWSSALDDVDSLALLFMCLVKAGSARRARCQRLGVRCVHAYRTNRNLLPDPASTVFILTSLEI